MNIIYTYWMHLILCNLSQPDISIDWLIDCFVFNANFNSISAIILCDNWKECFHLLDSFEKWSVIYIYIYIYIYTYIYIYIYIYFPSTDIHPRIKSSGRYRSLRMITVLIWKRTCINLFTVVSAFVFVFDQIWLIIHDFFLLGR
jgi:hypothetical protein